MPGGVLLQREYSSLSDCRTSGFPVRFLGINELMRSRPAGTAQAAMAAAAQ